MLTRNDRLKTTYEYEVPECFLLQEEIQDRVNFSLMYSEIDTTNKNKDYITSSYVCANHGTQWSYCSGRRLDAFQRQNALKYLLFRKGKCFLD